MALNYPNTLPVDSIKEIVRIIQVGNVAPEKATLAKHLWIVQGYAQFSLLGDPDVPGGMVGVVASQALAVVPDTMPELVVELQKIVDAHEGKLVAQALPLPPAWLVQLILQELVRLLMNYLSK